MPELTVASFNAHWGVGRFAPFPRARLDVPAVVRALEAEVVVVQEAFVPHAGPGMLDQLAGDGFHVEAIRFVTLDLTARPQVADPGEGWWALAVASRFPVLTCRELPIGRVFHDPAGARHALQVSLDVAGAPVELVAVHVSSKLWYLGPLVHLVHLRSRLPRRDGGPAIVVGDCNLWGPAVGALLPGWRRTVRGRTYPAHAPHSQIDHVLVNGAVDYLGGEVLDDVGSDHRPIRARLRVGAAPEVGAAPAAGRRRRRR